MKKYSLLCAVVLLNACSLNSAYERPALPVTDSWPMDNADAAARQVSWKDFFKSPNLQQIIQIALDNNRNLRIAVLRVEEARAVYRVTRADRVPSIDAKGAMSRQKIPENAVSGLGFPTGNFSDSIITSQYSANVGMTAFELDLFGRVKNENRRALEKYFATEEAQSTARISLIAEVANTYLTYLADKKALLLAQETLDTQKKFYDLTKKNFNLGEGTQFDVDRAKTSIEAARTDIAQYDRRVEQSKNALVLLMGTDQDQALLDKETLDDVALMEDLPVGVPSAVLLNRPDVREAEHNLEAEHANIGVARAAFFPAIRLTANAGVASDGLSNLFSSGSGLAWTFAPNVTLPIFEGGRNQANLDQANASQKIAATTYEKTIQSAFREVADALAARRSYADQLAAQKSLVSAAEQSHTTAKAVYEGGMGDYLSVLDTQRSLYAAQQGQVILQERNLANLVMLYKSLGGGNV